MNGHATAPLLNAAIILFAAAVTPGPNNFAVLQVATRRGPSAVWSAIAGVVLGSVALLSLFAAGASALLFAAPALRRVLALLATLALAAIGMRMVLRKSGDGPFTQATGGRLGTAVGLFVFQFVNPNAWVLVAAVTASTPPGLTANSWFAALVALDLTILTGCLLLWSCAGSFLGSHFGRPRENAWLSRGLGALTMASAFLLWWL